MVYSFGLVYLNIFYKFCANLRYAIALEIEATCLAPHRVVAADGALPPELLLFLATRATTDAMTEHKASAAWWRIWRR